MRIRSGRRRWVLRELLSGVWQGLRCGTLLSPSHTRVHFRHSRLLLPSVHNDADGLDNRRPRTFVWRVARSALFLHQNDAYERMWFLVVPPTMTLLDDYEIRYKVEGMKIVDAMIKNVPSDLLRRTGVTELLFTVSTIASRLRASTVGQDLLCSPVPFWVFLACGLSVGFP